MPHGDWLNLARDLDAVADAAPYEAMRVVSETATKLRDLARAGCPVESGNLRRSIGIDLNLGDTSAIVGPGAYYGRFVEFGTSKMAPRPFMGPAADQIEPIFVEALSKTGGDIL